MGAFSHVRSKRIDTMNGYPIGSILFRLGNVSLEVAFNPNSLIDGLQMYFETHTKETNSCIWTHNVQKIGLKPNC